MLTYNRIEEIRIATGAAMVNSFKFAETIEAEVTAPLLAKIDELEAENKAIRTLMDTYNLGGWTDNLRCISDLQAKVAELSRQEGEINDALGIIDCCMVVPLVEDLRQQLARAKAVIENLRNRLGLVTGIDQEFVVITEREEGK